jgi:sec-independent protein translocase protein TatA
MMGGLSIWHWLIVGVIILLLFGKGRFSDMMGDVAKGLKSFKKGMAEDDDKPAVPPARLRDERPVEPAAPIDLTSTTTTTSSDPAAERREP